MSSERRHLRLEPSPEDRAGPGVGGTTLALVLPAVNGKWTETLGLSLLLQHNLASSPSLGLGE